MALPAATAGLGLPSWPTWAEVERAFSVAVLPQLALTLMNAVVLTALLAQDYFGKEARHVTPARLSVTSGLGNLALTPLGALPMCHGAGGLAAHYRFGARSGTAPLALGLALVALALLAGAAGLQVLAAVPLAAVGALLLVAAGELAFSRRLIDASPS
jgi:MFS superfamily sulfate permease-like transporter